MRQEKVGSFWLAAVACFALGASVPAPAHAQKTEPAKADLVRQLGSEAGLDEAKTASMRAQLEAELAMRAMLERKAIAAGLDKLPRVAASVALAKQNSLAQAYLEAMQMKLAPSDAELRSDYDSAFSEKKLAKVKFALYASDAKASEALESLKSGALGIDALAKMGDDKVLAQKQFEFGWIPFDAMPEQVAAAIMAAPKEKWPEKPIKTPYGNMIYQLDEIKDGREKTFDQAKPELFERRKQLMTRVEMAKLKIEADKIAKSPPR